MNTKKIATYRKKNKLTQSQLAKKLKMTASWVGAMESGKIASVTPKVAAKFKKLMEKRA